MTYIVVAVYTYVFPEVEKTLQKNQPVSLKVSLSILSVPLSSTGKTAYGRSWSMQRETVPDRSKVSRSTGPYKVPAYRAFPW